jgi:hypothetical protein
MLKELLPYKQPQPENPQDPLSNVSSDANLLGKRELFKAEVNIRAMMSRFYKGIVFVMCTLCLALLSLNYHYTSKINKLDERKTQLVNEMLANEENINQARKLQSQIDDYKRILGIRKKMSVPIERVFTITNDNMELLVFIGKPEGFSVVARSKDPSSIVKVLYQLINSGEISRLVLKSADVDTDTKIYRISFEGIYK